MMNILEVSNLLQQKGNLIGSNRLASKAFNKTFSSIFNNEKENALFNGQNTAKDIGYRGQSKLSINQANSSHNPNQLYHNKDLASNNKPGNEGLDTAANHATDLDKDKKLKKYGDANIDKITDEFEDDLENQDGAELLQSILLAMLENIEGLENIEYDGLDKDLQVGMDQLQDMDILKEQLIALLDAEDISVDSYKENLRMVINTINEMKANTLLPNKDELDVLDSNGLWNEIGELENAIKTILGRLNTGKEISSHIQDLHIKNNLLDTQNEESIKEGQPVKKEETFLNVDDAGKIVENATKPIDGFVLTDGEEGFFKQFKGDDKILPEQQFAVDYQQTGVQSILLKIVENEVIEPKQFISEIAQRVNTLILKGKNEMKIQLTPENLGKLSIKIGLNEGSLTGKIYAENYSVKETIEANLNQLRNSLEEKGLNIAGLEVHINDNSQNFQRDLYEPAFANKRKLKTGPMGTVSNLVTVEENLDQVNPYLTASQFDSLV